MRKIQIMFLCLIATMMFGACIERGNCPSNWICQYGGSCPNGKTMYVCVNPSTAEGGWKVGNTCYACADFSIGDCMDALQDANIACSASTADGNIPLQEQEMASPELIDEKLKELREAFERFKE